MRGTEMVVNPNVYPLSRGRTKYEILTARAAELREEALRIENTLAGMEMLCGLSCGGCGTVLETEADFAKHFIVTDERFLNLGECPNSSRR